MDECLKRVAVVQIQQIFTELLLYVNYKISDLMTLSTGRWIEIHTFKE